MLSPMLHLVSSSKRIMWVLLSVLFPLSALAGGTTSYLYDNIGNVKQVVCTPTTCAAEGATCGTVPDGCGGPPLNCDPVGGCPTGQVCVSNQCYMPGPVTFNRNSATGNILVSASASDIAVSSQFLSSKGAFASAVTFPSVSNPGLVCPLSDLSQGLSATTECVKYTGECQSCKQDPNAYTGEISCWCQKGENEEMNRVPAASSQDYIAHLLVDVNKDGDMGSTDDETRWSDKGKTNGLDFLRAYNISDDVMRLEWEDQNTPPDGDYNDYISTLSIRECDGNPFPSNVTPATENLKCANACGVPNRCPTETTDEDLFRVSAAIEVDSASDSQNREAKGGMIMLTVNAYNASDSAEKDIAICPVLWLKWPNEGMPNRFDCNKGTFPPENVLWADYDGMTQKGACTSTLLPTPIDGHPTCGGNYPLQRDCDKFPISFARLQETQTQCQALTTDQDDKIHLPTAGSRSCGSSPVSVAFEIAASDVDALIPNNPELHLEPLMGSVLTSLIDHLDVHVFHNIKADQFFCPSGVHVAFHAVHPDVADATTYTMKLGTTNFKILPRQ